MMLSLHGSVFVLAALWLLKRHLNLSVRGWLTGLRNQSSKEPGGAP
jgi:hypothetical protein